MLRIAVACFLGLGSFAVATAEDRGTVTELGGLKSTAPKSWKQQPAATAERVYQFEIPRADGDRYDGQLLIFYFGPAGGGGVKANLERWKGMIKPAEGAKDEDTYKVSEFKVGQVQVTQLEATGTYIFKRRPFDPNEKGEARPDYKFIGVIFESPNGPFFIRMVGPKKTIDSHRAGFDEWLKSFK